MNIQGLCCRGYILCLIRRAVTDVFLGHPSRPGPLPLSFPTLFTEEAFQMPCLLLFSFLELSGLRYSELVIN